MEINLLLIGAIAAMNFVASLFFLRFFKTTRDRFFLFFAVAFSLEGLCRILLGLHGSSGEYEPLFYLLRLLSYLLILYAILDKNLASRRKV
jgi:hypothetical protein